MRQRLRQQRAAHEPRFLDDLDSEGAHSAWLTVAPEPDAAQPLPDAFRARMEAGFGHDFSQVRVHADASAAEAARAYDARAYTFGHSIVFGAGQYAPDTPFGQRLIAHELSHVVQQRDARAGAAGPRQANDAAERDADGAATRVLAGYPAPQLAALGSVAQLQRWPGAWMAPSQAPAKEDPIAESERAQKDYTNALQYVNDFYASVLQCLLFAQQAQSTAIGIFRAITSTADAPDMTKELIMSVLEVGFNSIGGWTLVEKGLTNGVFALDVKRLERGVGEKLGAKAVEVLEKTGVKARDEAFGKFAAERIKEGVGAAPKVAEGVKDEPDTEAGRSVDSSNKAAEKSLMEWGLRTALATQEKGIAEANVRKLSEDKSYRGKLVEETKAALGTQPDDVAMGKQVLEVSHKFELEMYKERFGPNSGVHIVEIQGGAGVYSRTLHGGGDSMGRVIARISELLGWGKAEGHQNDLRVAAWLGVPTVVQHVHESGRFL